MFFFYTCFCHIPAVSLCAELLSPTRPSFWPLGVGGALFPHNLLPKNPNKCIVYHTIIALYLFCIVLGIFLFSTHLPSASFLVSGFCWSLVEESPAPLLCKPISEKKVIKQHLNRKWEMLLPYIDWNGVTYQVSTEKAGTWALLLTHNTPTADAVVNKFVLLGKALTSVSPWEQNSQFVLALLSIEIDKLSFLLCWRGITVFLGLKEERKINRLMNKMKYQLN